MGRLSSLLLALIFFAAIPVNMGAQQLSSVPGAQVTHPWAGKKVAFLGDSITDKRRIGTKKCYWEYLAEWLGLTPCVYAINGRQMDDIPSQAARLKEECGDSIDAIIVFIGTNDYNAGLPIGEWFNITTSEVEEGHGYERRMAIRAKRNPVMDNDTFRGRINKAFSTLKHEYPSKQIIVMTPLHRAYANFSDKNIQPDESYANICGEYLDKYVDSIREGASIWALPVIDLYSVSGLYPMEKSQSIYFHDENTDLLHPNAEGHKRMAYTMYYQLLSLPCVF